MTPHTGVQEVEATVNRTYLARTANTDAANVKFVKMGNFELKRATTKRSRRRRFEAYKELQDAGPNRRPSGPNLSSQKGASAPKRDLPAVPRGKRKTPGKYLSRKGRGLTSSSARQAEDARKVPVEERQDKWAKRPLNSRHREARRAGIGRPEGPPKPLVEQLTPTPAHFGLARKTARPR